jgi:hypothetical protein
MKASIIQVFVNQPPNGLRYWRLARDWFRNGALYQYREKPKNAVRTSRPVHAVLGAFAKNKAFSFTVLCQHLHKRQQTHQFEYHFPEFHQ